MLIAAQKQTSFLPNNTNIQLLKFLKHFSLLLRRLKAKMAHQTHVNSLQYRNTYPGGGPAKPGGGGKGIPGGKPGGLNPGGGSGIPGGAKGIGGRAREGGPTDE